MKRKSLNYEEYPFCFRIVSRKQPYIQFSKKASEKILQNKNSKVLEIRHFLNGEMYFSISDVKNQDNYSYSLTKRNNIITVVSKTLTSLLISELTDNNLNTSKADIELIELSNIDEDSLMQFAIGKSIDIENEELDIADVCDKQETQEKENNIKFNVEFCVNGFITEHDKEKRVYSFNSVTQEELIAETIRKFIDDNLLSCDNVDCDSGNQIAIEIKIKQK